MKKLIILLYGVIAYFLFFGVFLYSIAFVGGFTLDIGGMNLVPKHVNTGTDTAFEMAVLINVLLLSVFAIQHSVMARPAFKKWWTKIIPEAAERSTYVVLTSLALILIYWKWQPMSAIIWDVQNETAALVIWGVFWLGWLIVLLSTFMINHFHLFGLTQIYENFKDKKLGGMGFTTNYFYKLVRHPIMTGFIIAFWATPTMTAGHLMFAIVTTAYILIAVKFFEEKDLQNELGEAYEDYQKRVPMLVPFTKFGK